MDTEDFDDKLTRNVYDIIVYQWRNFQNPEHLGRLIKESSPNPGTPQPYSKALITKEENALRGKIDQACQQFAWQKDWPPGMSAAETLMVFERLNEAKKLLGFLNDKFKAAANYFSESELLEYLLVDYWHQLGCDRYLFRHCT